MIQFNKIIYNSNKNILSNKMNSSKNNNQSRVDCNQ